MNLEKTKQEMKESIKKVLDWTQHEIMSKLKKEFIEDNKRIKALLEELKEGE